MENKQKFSTLLERKLRDANPLYADSSDTLRSIDAVIGKIKAAFKDSMNHSGKSQNQVAEALGIDASAVSKTLSGDGDLGLRTALKYALAIGVDFPAIVKAAILSEEKLRSLSTPDLTKLGEHLSPNDVVEIYMQPDRVPNALLNEALASLLDENQKRNIVSYVRDAVGFRHSEDREEVSFLTSQLGRLKAFIRSYSAHSPEVVGIETIEIERIEGIRPLESSLQKSKKISHPAE